MMYYSFYKVSEVLYSLHDHQGETENSFDCHSERLAFEKEMALDCCSQRM